MCLHDILSIINLLTQIKRDDLFAICAKRLTAGPLPDRFPAFRMGQRKIRGLFCAGNHDSIYPVQAFQVPGMG